MLAVAACATSPLGRSQFKLFSDDQIARMLAGAEVTCVHLNDLFATSSMLLDFHVLAFIGGFSFGDHLGAGTVLANRLRHRVGSELNEFITSGRLAIGICNGFQTMTRLGPPREIGVPISPLTLT